MRGTVLAGLDRGPFWDGLIGQGPHWATFTAPSPAQSGGDEGWLCSPTMTERISLTPARALDRLAAWQLAIRAENKSPATIHCYTDATTRYLRWCTDGDHPPMSRNALNDWISGMLAAGAAPGTARTRQLSVRRFASWRTEDGYLPAYLFPGVKAPHVPTPIVQPLTYDELRALIKTCAEPDNVAGTDVLVGSLHHRRDEAIIRLMLETAIRSGEVIAFEVGDVDLDAWLITIRRGKGGRGRVIPIGPDTALAIERYSPSEQSTASPPAPLSGLATRAAPTARTG